MSNAFEYGDALLPQSEQTNNDVQTSSSLTIESNQPYLNLATLVSHSFSLRDVLTFHQVPHGCTGR